MPLALLAVTLTACGDPSPPPAALPHESALPRESAPPREPDPPAEPARSEPARAPVDPAVRARLRAAIRAGRQAARQQRYAEAAAHFDRALALDDKSSRLRCEAGYLQYRAGQLEQAERSIVRAIAAMPAPERAPEPLRRELAMCLYNAGLVHEARGRVTSARDAWESSLRLRPNDTVRARLAALGTRAAEEARPPLSLDGRASFEALARVLRDRWCEEGGAGFTREHLDSCDAITVALREPAGSAQGIEARLVTLTYSEPEDYGEDWRTALIVKAGGRARAYVLGDGYMPGAGGISAETEVRVFAYEERIEGGPPEVRIEITSGENDEDMGLCERHGGTDRDLFLCSAAPAIHCARLPIERVTYHEYDGGCGGDPADEDGERIGDDGPRSTREGYRLGVTLDGTEAEIRIAEDLGTAPPRGLVGRRSIASLVEDVAFAHPPW